MTVIVIGAGVIGCACAHALASAGVRVHVVEARRVGQGASQASAGVLAPYIEGHESGPLRTLGRRSLDLYDEFIARVSRDSGRPVEYARGGTLEIALDEEELARHRAFAQTLAAEGVDAQLVDAQELQRLEPSAAAGAIGGLLIGLHGYVSVPDLTEALATAAVRAGAQLSLGTRVTSIRDRSGSLVVETNAGTLNADQVVLAAGSWSSQIACGPDNPIPVKPVRGQLLHLSWPGQTQMQRVLWGTDCYIVPWKSGRVLVGATVEDAGFDERATAAGVRDLLEAACTLVPLLWKSSFLEVRVGLRPEGPGGLPVIGRSAAMPGLVYATGHYRNGVLLAPLTAELVKKLVLKQSDPAFETLSPARLHTM